MLKVVGTENGKTVDEKVIISDEGKITKFGAFLICLDILVDFTDKFEDRYGIYFKAQSAKTYKPFNQVKALTNVLNLISSFESK